MSGRAYVLALVVAAVLAGGTQACSPARLGEAVRVLADIDAGAGPSALKEQTPAPVRRRARPSPGPPLEPRIACHPTFAAAERPANRRVDRPRTAGRRLDLDQTRIGRGFCHRRPGARTNS